MMTKYLANAIAFTDALAKMKQARLNSWIRVDEELSADEGPVMTGQLPKEVLHWVEQGLQQERRWQNKALQ